MASRRNLYVPRRAEVALERLTAVLSERGVSLSEWFVEQCSNKVKHLERNRCTCGEDAILVGNTRCGGRDGIWKRKIVDRIVCNRCGGTWKEGRR